MRECPPDDQPVAERILCQFVAPTVSFLYMCLARGLTDGSYLYGVPGMGDAVRAVLRPDAAEHRRAGQEISPWMPPTEPLLRRFCFRTA